MRLTLLSIVLLAAMLVVAPARADTPAPSRAETLFRGGRVAAEAGDFTTACDRFAESERLEPAPGTLMNLADCEEHLGRLVNAREHFDLAASGFRRDDGRRAYAANRAADIEKRLSHLLLRLSPGVPADATVLKGGVPLDPGAIGRAMPADPGKLTIVVTATGRERRTYTLDLKEGQSVEATLDAGDALAAAQATQAPEGQPLTATKPAASGRRTVGFVVGGVGIAGLAAGGVTGVLALGKASTVKSHCDANLACDQQGVDAASSGKTLALVSTISFAAGAVLAAAGVYLVLSSSSASKPSDDRPRASRAGTLVLIPYATPYGAGAATTWTF
jgi:hypothetical protein